MVISSTIRTVVAGVLLVIFALGITPKRTLHNIVANHKDGTSKSAAKKQGAQLSKFNFNCQVDNLVCESPFTPQSSILYVSSAEVFPAYLNVFVWAQYSFEHISFGLRGPPIADFADLSV